MSWASNGDAVCDSCQQTRIGHLERAKAIQMIRAGGWHHAVGVTIGGMPYEAILCKTCARDERKRSRAATPLQDEQALPLNWEQWRIDGSASGSGYASR